MISVTKTVFDGDRNIAEKSVWTVDGTVTEFAAKLVSQGWLEDPNPADSVTMLGKENGDALIRLLLVNELTFNQDLAATLMDHTEMGS